MAVPRKVNEVILLYELEPELRDIYVEGITDKLIFERFLEKYSIKNVEVKDIVDIDFTELYEEQADIKHNNKKKLIALSNKLVQDISINLNGIYIVVDIDFDEIKDSIETNQYLLYTDYNSIESYLMTPLVIDIFYKTFLRSKYPLNGEQTLEQLKPILINLFLIRLSLSDVGNFDKEKITDLKKTIKIDKKTGHVDFDTSVHLDKILNNISYPTSKNDLVEIINEYNSKIIGDPRKFIRGHDFIHLFFIYIDKIKNKINLSEDILERSLYQCLDYSELRKEKLFTTIESKYKIV